MTAGGLIQIITASGEQDRYLTANPEITFFKAVYKRHTNFSIETIEEVFYNSEGFGRQARCIIPRKGDLISNMMLYIKLGSLNPKFHNQMQKNINTQHDNTKSIINRDGEIYNKCACINCLTKNGKDKLEYGWVNSLGHALAKSITIEIGGQRINKQYGEWYEIWSELTLTEEQRLTYYEMIGKVDQKSFKSTTFTGPMELFIPLNLWFCRHKGLALPIMGLFYHHVELIVDFRSFDELWVTNKKNAQPPKIPSMQCQIYIDYVYLDTDERRAFYQESNIYLIEQLQCIDNCNALGSSATIILDQLNHPCKELVWVLQRNDVTCKPDGLYDGTRYPKGNDWFNYSPFTVPSTTIKEETFSSAKITLNGIDRFREKPAKYFRLCHPYLYHTRGPSKYIYVYSFGFCPEDLQPQGQMNFSRISNAALFLKMKSRRPFSEFTVRTYATNYNVLIITAGMGSLLFNN